MTDKTFGFKRMEFPKFLRGHKLVLLDNKARLTIDHRLSFHITLHCQRCGKENTVRGKLPPEQSSKQKVPFLKLAALGGFKKPCNKK